MKTIPRPDLSGARILTAAEMNKIHFGGRHTPISPEQLEAMAQKRQQDADGNASAGK